MSTVRQTASGPKMDFSGFEEGLRPLGHRDVWLMRCGDLVVFF
jgi:hypothetical protein